MTRYAVRRTCYDKAHRCPGWAGGGVHLARVRRCAGGSLRDGYFYAGRHWRWRFNYHRQCRTVVLPYATRYVDPTWLAYVVRTRVRDWISDAADRRAFRRSYRCAARRYRCEEGDR